MTGQAWVVRYAGATLGLSLALAAGGGPEC